MSLALRYTLRPPEKRLPHASYEGFFKDSASIWSVLVDNFAVQEDTLPYSYPSPMTLRSSAALTSLSPIRCSAPSSCSPESLRSHDPHH